MAQENLADIKIPNEVYEEILGHVNALEKLLKPYLIALGPGQSQEIPKMSDKSIAFVEKTLDYSNVNKTFSPVYLDVEAMRTDVLAVKMLTQISRPLEQLLSGLDDTIMLCGSEAYVAALAYYNSVKQAAKMNIQDAKTIYSDLSVRFPGRSKRVTETV